MAQQEFIPYEQALELEELGFGEECFGCYQLAEFRDYRVGLEVDNKIVLNTLNGYRNYDDENQIPAPLYQQAFRWFRTKGYRSTISSDYETGLYYFDVWYNTQFMFETNYQHQTYEEAELACLKKLIEIVKNK